MDESKDTLTRPDEDGAAPQTEESVEKTEDAEAVETTEPVAQNAEDTHEAAENSEAVQPPKKKKGARIFWNVFLVVVIAIGIASLFGIVGEIDPEKGGSFVDVMRGASPLFCCILVLVVLAVMVLDTAKFCIVSKTVTGKMHLATSAKTSFIGKYYDAVTPFSTGGQPMQIYYLTTKGVSGGNSSAMVLIRYFSSITAWIIWGAVLMIWGTAKGILEGVDQKTLLLVTGWIGIGINLIIPVFITLCLIFPKFMYKLTNGLVKLGAKVKIVKDVEKTTERAFKVVNDFRTSFKVMATSPIKLIALMLVSFMETGLTFAVPFFVMKAFSSTFAGQWFEVFEVMALNAFATFGVSFIPTPGNSGVVEGLGALAFRVAAGSSIVWSVLFWRLSVFYVYILIGICITIYDIIVKNKKHKAKSS